MLGARSGVGCDLAGGARYLGEPVMPAQAHHRITVSMGKLPEMRRDLQRIKDHL